MENSRKIRLTLIMVIPFILFILVRSAVISTFYVTHQSDNIEENDSIIFGIDLSHYNGPVTWDSVGKHHPIRFMIHRRTMGIDGTDRRYSSNIAEARERGFIVGAYHYYRPDENSIKQAKNYCKDLKLEPGDFRPIVDLEVKSEEQSMDSLKLGLKRWLDYVEVETGVKPMIYTGLSFYKEHLQDEFSDYPLWIAAYSNYRRPELLQISDMYQFSERVRVKGIHGYVDANDLPRRNLSNVLLASN